MKKILFGIFAHPDDEAFGPAGTLLKLKRDGYDIHLILLTDGEAGVNIDNVADLAAIRLTEWQTSANILGATSTNALHYPDGALETIPTDEIDSRVKKIISNILKSYDDAVDISFMTFEPHGLTGHHDHIAASQLTSRLSAAFRAHEAWYFCLDSTQAPLDETTYYKPRAREDDYITKQVNVAAYLETIYRMIDAHYSQRADGTSRKALSEERLSKESFRVETY